MTDLETKLAEALREIERLSHNRGGDVNHVRRMFGRIASEALATYEREKAGQAEKISQMLAATGAIQPLGNWRDAQGSNYKAPIGAYKVGQFSPTGSQLVSVCKKGDKP